METYHNEIYEAPSTSVLEVSVEGVVCTSGVGANRSGYGDAIEDEWEDEWN